MPTTGTNINCRAAGLALTWATIEGYVEISQKESQAKSAAAANKALSLDLDNVEGLGTGRTVVV